MRRVRGHSARPSHLQELAQKCAVPACSHHTRIIRRDRQSIAPAEIPGLCKENFFFDWAHVTSLGITRDVVAGAVINWAHASEPGSASPLRLWLASLGEACGRSADSALECLWHHIRGWHQMHGLDCHWQRVKASPQTHSRGLPTSLPNPKILLKANQKYSTLSQSIKLA